MAEVTPVPPQTEFQKLSSTMTQYVFDLEQKVEQSFHVSQVASAFIVGAIIGFAVHWVL